MIPLNDVLFSALENDLLNVVFFGSLQATAFGELCILLFVRSDHFNFVVSRGLQHVKLVLRGSVEVVIHNRVGYFLVEYLPSSVDEQRLALK